jgi:transcriptional regulator with XRE-family HTH domain
MPRPNPLREILGERALARRIAYERERRGWSTEKLSRRMAEAGCPIHQSAIWKIEHADPPRRITYDEALGFARVFDTPLDDLAVLPEIAADKELRALVAEMDEIITQTGHALERFAELMRLINLAAAQLPGEAGDRLRGLSPDISAMAGFIRGGTAPTKQSADEASSGEGGSGEDRNNR